MLQLEEAGDRALRLGQNWEVGARNIAHLGSCHLGKYHWEDANWGKSFGKVPNIPGWLQTGSYTGKRGPINGKTMVPRGVLN